jgi:hypothetical protein
MAPITLDSLNLTNLYDRMTQGLYFSTEQCKEFLSPEQKRPLRHIDILGQGYRRASQC